MMEVPVVVHPRVSARHPEIEEEDAIRFMPGCMQSSVPNA